MTLCIAAACRYKDRDAVVLGSDFMVTGSSKADILDKLYWIQNQEWPVLISGDDISRAVELKEVYRQALEGHTGPIGVDDFLAVMYEPLRIQKHRIADQYVSRVLGLSYEHFLGRGRDELPEGTRRRVLGEISRLKFDAELLIVVFVRTKTRTGRFRKYKRPIIFKVGDSGVDWCEQYGCIGSGADTADAILAYREHDESALAYRAMYHVHEAMTLGAKVSPGVGEGVLAIVYDDGEDIVSKQPKGPYRRALRRMFARRIGPREVSRPPAMRDRDLGEF